ncbi:pulmonary surfactant-associated protein D-like [Platysternon megacephalum]|uniref:Pulmonary surfactant-associated protein D-like n=1 Tax=Platysternon megacephalum TaxID=55544 RepID=A0A4D9EFD9_9SAUR|nr:pulmonary surfactant-associated protein D-like [Platysternon megacephalum]
MEDFPAPAHSFGPYHWFYGIRTLGRFGKIKERVAYNITKLLSYKTLKLRYNFQINLLSNRFIEVNVSLMFSIFALSNYTLNGTEAGQIGTAMKTKQNYTFLQYKQRRNLLDPICHSIFLNMGL